MKRKGKYRKDYTEEAVSTAVSKVQNSQLGINKAARLYRVPRSTIRSRLKKKGQTVFRSGRKILTSEEEQTLENWIIDMQRRGLPVNKDQLADSVQQFLQGTPRPNPFNNNRPGKKWLDLFLKRHPNVSLRTPEFVTNASAKVSPEDIAAWFSKVETYLEEHGLADILSDPTRIINGDETSFQLNPKTKAVLAQRGSRNVYDIERNSSKLNITTMFSFHASGEVVPPTIIYPYKNIPHEVARSVPPSWGIAKSDNGWMNSDVFPDYIRNVLNPHLEAKKIKKPVLFIIDGHSSHINLKTSELCRELDIVLIALYPNVTRIMQPADVSAFKPLKNGWPKAVAKFRKSNPYEAVTLRSFAPVLQDCLRNSLTAQSVRSGFKASGLYPWDYKAIDFSKCLSQNASDDTLPDPADSQQSHLGDESFDPMTADAMRYKRTLQRCAAAFGQDKIKKFKSEFVYFDTCDEESLFNIFLILEENSPEAFEVIEHIDDENNDTEDFQQVEIVDIPIKLQNSSDVSEADVPMQPLDSSGDVPGVLKSEKALEDFLITPSPPKRGCKREYKSKRYHVLTSDEFITEFKQKEEDKKRLDEEKENRKIARTERKIANELKKKARAEQVANKKHATAGESSKRKGKKLSQKN